MIDLLRDLIRHKAFVNASLLRAIRQCEPAAQDEEIQKLLHHIIVANRFWLKLILNLPFAVEDESRVPDSLEAIEAIYQDTHAQEMEWILQTTEPELANRVETPFIPGNSFSIAEAMMQVCMHSHGHRAQCVVKLRQLGGTPPAMDYILWLKERPAADWS